jgi:hypothetical protein
VRQLPSSTPTVKLCAKCRNLEELAMHGGFFSYAFHIIAEAIDGISVIQLLKTHFLDQAPGLC